VHDIQNQKGVCWETYQEKIFW